jgi:Zn-dependent protease
MAALLSLNASLLAIALAVGVLLQSFGPRWVRSIFSAVRLDSPRDVAAVLASLAAAMVLHELGHLLAATTLNFEILGISFGPLRLQRLHGKQTVHFSGNRLFGCSVSALPRSMEHWRARMMVVVASGPAATLLAGVVSVCALASGEPRGWPTIFWSSFAQFNFFLFLLGLIPNGNKALLRNDATLFLALKRNALEAQEMRLYHQAAQLTIAGVRPCDYSGRFLRELAEWTGRADTNMLIAKTMMEWAIDCGDLSLADVWDRQALAQSLNCEPRQRNSVLAASACFDVLFRNDPAAARAKFAEVNFDSLFPPSFSYRARAACLLAGDRAARAPAQIIRAQYALPLGINYYNFDRMLLEKLHLKALSLLPASQITCCTNHAA